MEVYYVTLPEVLFKLDHFSFQCYELKKKTKMYFTLKLFIKT